MYVATMLCRHLGFFHFMHSFFLFLSFGCCIIILISTGPNSKVSSSVVCGREQASIH